MENNMHSHSYALTEYSLATTVAALGAVGVRVIRNFGMTIGKLGGRW